MQATSRTSTPLVLALFTCLVAVSVNSIAFGDTVAGLNYDPSSGQVLLDGTCAAGGVITNFVLESDGRFINTDDVENPFGSPFFTSNQNEISASDGSGVGRPAINLGVILESDLSLVELENVFSRATYVGELGSGQFEFDFSIFAIPEPSGCLFLIAIAVSVCSVRRRF